jgi:hypothetical protein
VSVSYGNGTDRAARVWLRKLNPGASLLVRSCEHLAGFHVPMMGAQVLHQV